MKLDVLSTFEENPQTPRRVESDNDVFKTSGLRILKIYNPIFPKNFPKNFLFSDKATFILHRRCLITSVSL